MKVLGLILLTLLILGVSVLLICLILNFFSNSLWFCNFWGWHKAPDEQGYDGCSLNGKCPRCNKEVMQDSQGNWF